MCSADMSIHPEQVVITGQWCSHEVYHLSLHLVMDYSFDPLFFFT